MMVSSHMEEDFHREWPKWYQFMLKSVSFSDPETLLTQNPALISDEEESMRPGCGLALQSVPGWVTEMGGTAHTHTQPHP